MGVAFSQCNVDTIHHIEATSELSDGSGNPIICGINDRPVFFVDPVANKDEKLNVRLAEKNGTKKQEVIRDEGGS